MVSSEPFHGFLTIGTLGTEPIISEPATPTFPMSAENITEEKTEVTEHDLKLINDELEKFLEAEAEEEENIESSGRNSYVSIITLSDKPMEGTNFEDHGKMMVCPLQGYLFGSIEFPETITEEKKEKASLGELFHRTKTTDETSLERNGKGVMPAKQMHKSVKNLMTKMLKKFHASPKNRMPSYSDTASVSTKKKLHKVRLLALDLLSLSINKFFFYINLGSVTLNHDVVQKINASLLLPNILDKWSQIAFIV